MSPRFRAGEGRPINRASEMFKRAVGVGVGSVGVGLDLPGDCGAGQYYDVLSLSCQNYGSDHTDPTTGFVLPGSCPDGTHWESGDCVVDAGITCGQDEVWSPADGQCVPICAMGFALTTFGCVPVACPDGYGRSVYDPEDAVCHECIYGYDANGFCADCPNGVGLDPSTGQCPNTTECPASQGRSDTTGACIDCTWGTDPDGTCTLCPVGTLYSAATDTCECPQGKVWSDAGGQCVPWNPPKQGGITPPPPAEKEPPGPKDDYKPPTNRLEGDTSFVKQALYGIGAAVLAALATAGIVKALKKKKAALRRYRRGIRPSAAPAFGVFRKKGPSHVPHRSRS